jgi:hypothetical protein
MKCNSTIVLILALASFAASAQTTAPPCENNVSTDVNGNLAPCSPFTTKGGALITNGGFPVNYFVDTQDGKAVTSGFVAIQAPNASVELPTNPTATLGFPGAFPIFEQGGTLKSEIVTGGPAAKYPAKTAPPLQVSATFDLGQEVLYALCGTDANGNPTCYAFNWQGSSKFSLNFTGRYVCGGGRDCLSHVPVYQVQAGSGEVWSTFTSVAQ